MVLGWSIRMPSRLQTVSENGVGSHAHVMEALGRKAERNGEKDEQPTCVPRRDTR